MDIEALGISGVKNQFKWSKYIKPEIFEGDKTPLEDGFLHIYKDTKKTKHGLTKIMVQVKGCTKYIDTAEDEFVGKLKNGDIKFDIFKSTLEYFKNYGGIFFVNYITTKNELATDEDERYSEFLTYYILYPLTCRELLDKIVERDRNKDKISDNPSLSVPFKLFPKKEKKYYNLLQNIELNTRVQISHADNPMYYFNDFYNAGFIDSSKGTIEKKFVRTDMSPFEVFQAYSDTSTPTYLKPNNSLDISIPIESPSQIVVVPRNKPIPVGVNGINYLNGKYVIINKKEYIQISKGICVPVVVADTVAKTSKINSKGIVVPVRENVTIDLSDNIEVLKKEIKFLRALNEHHTIDFFSEVAITNVFLNIDKNKAFYEYIQYCEDMCNMYDTIKKTYSLDLSKLNISDIEKDFEHFNVLYDKGGTITSLKSIPENTAFLYNFVIGEYRILLCLLLSDCDTANKNCKFSIYEGDLLNDLPTIDVNNSLIYLKYHYMFYEFYISDTFISNLDDMMNYVKKVISSSVILRENDYITSICEGVSNEELATEVFSLYISLLLKVISFYDKALIENKLDSKYSDAIGVLIENLADNLYSCDDNPDNEIPHEINRLQVRYRLNKLDDSDKLRLRKLSKSNDTEVQLYAYLLLDDTNKVRELFNEITPEQRDYIKTFPIFNIVKKHIN